MNDLLFEEANMLLAYLRNEYKRIEDELSHMPSGRLTIARSRRWTKWYLHDGEKTSYLPKSESEFASIMARKRFSFRI